MQLENYIREVLKMTESGGIASLARELRKKREDLIEAIESIGELNPFFGSDTSNLYNIILSCNSNLKEIGAGAFRKVYAESNSDWVFKIKI